MSDQSLQTPASRDYARVALVLCCVVAAVLAGVVVPTLAGGGLGDSPASSLVPAGAMSSGPGGEAADAQSSGSDPGAGSGGRGTGGLGALNPSDTTDVGGAVSVDDSAYRSQDTGVHLTVRSPEPAYWRTGSYDRYTGSGWERTGGSRPYDGAIETSGVQGQRVEYRVTLNRSARAVPTVWRPRRVDGLDGLQVTDGRAVRSPAVLDAGTTYGATSHLAPRDPAVLRSTGRDYPTDIADRYATSDGGSERLEGLTDDVTAGADNPYDKARSIEAWLESNKDYSLNVSRTSDDMAETFVFEMERGYCEYFATSMVVMLRSQGVPARYVVGYSTGQQVAPDTYRVRGMNAHAWVEVYFEEVGWVRFDPTPGSDRLQRERQSMQEQVPDEEYAPRERGSPGEAFTPETESTPGSPPGAGSTPDEEVGENATGTPDDGNATEPGGTSGDTEFETGDGYEISLNRSAVPGVAVTVSVTRGGDPVSDRTVLFDGEPVGTTGADGTVTARIPYAEQLRVTVEDGSTASLAPPGARPGDGRLYSVTTPDVSTDVTVPVETNATVAVTGERVAGAAVTVTAAVEDVPVQDGAVLVDGERVATTDAEGRATITLPGTPGNVTVAVQRDPVSGETTVSVPDLDVTVEPSLPLVLPLADAAVEVRSDGQPVRDAPVRIDGELVAETGFNGTAAVSLPFASGATVTVTARGLTRETAVTGLFVNLGLLLAGVALLIAGGLVVAYRRGHTPRDVLAGLRRLPRVTGQYAQRLLVALVGWGDELAARAVARLRKTWAYLLDAVRRRRSLADLWHLALAWLRERRQSIARSDRDAVSVAPGSANAADGHDSGERATAYRDVRTAWRQFLSRVSVRRAATKSPGEIARHAVRHDGLPAEPVRELRDAFRDVEYGSQPAADRLDRVERALAAIEEERE